MTRPWLSVRRSERLTGEGWNEAAAIGSFKAIPFRACAHVRAPLGGLYFRRLIEAGGSLAKDDAGGAADEDDADGDCEVVGHGMRPAGGIAEVLADPEQQNGGNDRELTGDDEQGVAEVAPFVEGFDLVWGQVAFFGGKQGIRFGGSDLQVRFNHRLRGVRQWRLANRG